LIKIITCILYCRYTGTTSRVLNLSSYNYLGFAESEGPCIEDVVQRIKDDGVSSCSGRRDLGIILNMVIFVSILLLGNTNVLKELEALTARFVGKDDAMVFGMGFATNSGNIPSLMGKVSLKCYAVYYGEVDTLKTHYHVLYVYIKNFAYSVGG